MQQRHAERGSLQCHQQRCDGSFMSVRAQNAEDSNLRVGDVNIVGCTGHKWEHHLATWRFDLGCRSDEGEHLSVTHLVEGKFDEVGVGHEIYSMKKKVIVCVLLELAHAHPPVYEAIGEDNRMSIRGEK